MAQGLLLREHGYRTDHGVLYFAGSRTRVDVPFAAELEARTLRLIDEARAAAASTILPDPLEDSPKCNGCSLAGICLPDETLALRQSPPERDASDPVAVRRLYPRGTTRSRSTSRSRARGSGSAARCWWSARATRSWAGSGSRT
jgi:CRISP-associated protein Cas1